jgi:stage II sporulation protein M
MRMWIYFSLLTLLFFVSALSGYISAMINPENAESVVGQFFTQFEFIKELDPLKLFALIFLNNSLKSLFAMLTGFFFGIFPVLFIFLNGFFIGVVVFVKSQEIGLTNVMMLLLPHGIFEIPAVLMASSYGVWLGGIFYEKVRGEDVSIGRAYRFAIRKFFTKIVPILLLAAFIETFITPLIATTKI